ncbi:MAG: hypothetical protein Unbinned5089contig1000_28 [Prokaryotic dsDNA virus sp.]|nr:MAG: hypothetical protein Unbinned5089contig1000_28 [Prokaryotic dsDNA virus sp.]
MNDKFQKVIDFYNSTTPEQWCIFLSMISDKITIPIPKIDKDGVSYIDCVGVSKEAPACPNGGTIQLNTDDFEKHSNLLEENNPVEEIKEIWKS